MGGDLEVFKLFGINCLKNILWSLFLSGEAVVPLTYFF